ncbi:hypothetical protein IF2G_04148 [Cordyceps javanica]|nr:hypothetical protein IF2G_04148 [Cordyceps javanica]
MFTFIQLYRRPSSSPYLPFPSLSSPSSFHAVCRQDSVSCPEQGESKRNKTGHITLKRIPHCFYRIPQRDQTPPAQPARQPASTNFHPNYAAPQLPG